MGKQWIFNRGSKVHRLKERRWIEAAEDAWQVASAAGMKGFPSCSADAEDRNPYDSRRFVSVDCAKMVWKPRNRGDVRR
jgi:hypothetical protein